MVYGNLSAQSCTGKMYTRNPDNGDNEIYGCYLFSLSYYRVGEYIRCAEGDEVLESVERQTYRLKVYYVYFILSL